MSREIGMELGPPLTRRRLILPEKKKIQPKRQKTKGRSLVAADRRARAVQLRIEGHTFVEIGARLGVSPQSAHEMVTSALRESLEQRREGADELRRIEQERLELAANAIAAKVKRGELGAVHQWERLSARRSKLLGLDAPESLELAGPGGKPIEVSDPRAIVLDRLAKLAPKSE
jgi:microsomal dipeptidase-like Zn-dependent dipeptidase